MKIRNEPETKGAAILFVVLAGVIILGSVATTALQVAPPEAPEETGASRPLEVIGPPYAGQYRETSAQIPPNQVMDWWGDVDGGFVDWSGKYDLCFDFIIYGAGPNGEDLFTSSPCLPCPEVIFTPLPTNTPTPTYTPTVTPTATVGVVPTPVQ